MQQYYQDEEDENRLLRKVFGADTPPLSKLQNNVDILFLNVHPIWEENRPAPPGVIYVGELHQNQEKELPKDRKAYLDSSKNGVIYVSFGTNVNPNVLPPETIQAMIKTISQVPYNVLWKWNEDEMEGKPNNVMISKWFPQSDLLNEAITAGVPMLAIPVVGDQTDQICNAGKYVRHKIGAYLDLKDLYEESLKVVITSTIENKSYRENIIGFKALMADQPMSPLERAVWWTRSTCCATAARAFCGRPPPTWAGQSTYYEIHVVFKGTGFHFSGVSIYFLSIVLVGIYS